MEDHVAVLELQFSRQASKLLEIDELVKMVVLVAILEDRNVY